MSTEKSPDRTNPNHLPTLLFSDLRHHSWMYLKAALMLLAAILASILLLVDHPNLHTAALLAIAVWGFSRAYYFAFYVIQHYIDPTFRFSGLTSFLLYVARNSAARKKLVSESSP